MISEEEEETLAWRLRSYREQASITQAEAAKVLGLDATAITKIEHGDRSVSAMELVALAKAYQVPVNTLLGVFMDYEEKPRYKQLSSLPVPAHQHTFDIAATDMTIVRWCPDCGKTWIIVRYAQGGLFEGTWKEIQEAQP